MQIVLPLAMAAVLSAGVVAQVVPTQDPGKSTKDNNIEYTSRSSIPGSIRGRLATMLATGYLAGARSLRSFTFISQDQDAATQQTFWFEVRAQDPATGFPDWPGNLNAPLFRTPLTPPRGFGIAGWQWTVTPTTPIPVSGEDAIYFVWEVPPDPGWALDGISIQMGAGSPAGCGVSGAPACCLGSNIGGWERPRGHAATGSQANIENLAPADTLAGPLAYASLDRQYFHWVGLGPDVIGGSNKPALQGLASNPGAFCAINEPNTGAAAMDPDVDDALAANRNDDIGWRIRGGAGYANGVAFVFNAQDSLASAAPTAFGDLWVNPFDPLFPIAIQGPIGLDAAGLGDVLLPLGAAGGPVRAAVAGMGNLHSQALVVDPAFRDPQLTNLHAFRFVLAGGAPFSISATTPATVPSAFPRRHYVQNGGPGHVTVELLDASNNVLAASRVRERTGRSIATVAGTVNLRITTQNQDLARNNPVQGFVR